MFRCLPRSLAVRALFPLLALLVLVGPARSEAATSQETVQTAWRLLDYVAVDYGGAGQKGPGVGDRGFAEMREFTARAEGQLQSLRVKGARPSLLTAAHELRSAVDAKAPAADVASR